MTSPHEHLKAWCSYLLAWRLHCFINFGLFVFCRRKQVTTTETTITLTRRIWQFLTWHNDPFINPDSFFCTDSHSTSLGTAKAGNLKLDLRALKCRNPNFFPLNTFLHTLLAIYRRHFRNVIRYMKFVYRSWNQQDSKKEVKLYIILLQKIYYVNVPLGFLLIFRLTLVYQ